MHEPAGISVVPAPPPSLLGMRLVALALLAVVALPATAQSQFSDESGIFLTFDEFRLQRVGGGSGGEGQVGVGYRFGNGADVALHGGYGIGGLGDDSQDHSLWSLGGVAGYSVRPADRTLARVEGGVTYARFSTTFQESATRPFLAYDGSSLQFDASATVGRDLPIAGTLAVRPTVGVYGQARRFLTFEGSDNVAALATGDWRHDLGLHVEAPITFRLLGTTAAVVPALRRSLGGNGVPAQGGTLGFRLNF